MLSYVVFSCVVIFLVLNFVFANKFKRQRKCLLYSLGVLFTMLYLFQGDITSPLIIFSYVLVATLITVILDAMLVSNNFIKSISKDGGITFESNLKEDIISDFQELEVVLSNVTAHIALENKLLETVPRSKEYWQQDFKDLLQDLSKYYIEGNISDIKIAHIHNLDIFDDVTPRMKWHLNRREMRLNHRVKKGAVYYSYIPVQDLVIRIISTNRVTSVIPHLLMNLCYVIELMRVE